MICGEDELLHLGCDLVQMASKVQATMGAKGTLHQQQILLFLPSALEVVEVMPKSHLFSLIIVEMNGWMARRATFQSIHQAVMF